MPHGRMRVVVGWGEGSWQETDGTLQKGDWGVYDGPPHMGVALAVLRIPQPPMCWGSPGLTGTERGRGWFSPHSRVRELAFPWRADAGYQDAK